jgi:hypothetical protein
MHTTFRKPRARLTIRGSLSGRREGGDRQLVELLSFGVLQRKSPLNRSLAFIASAVLCLAVYFAAQRFTASRQWMARFEDQIHSQKTVKLSDLVDFEWEEVFVLQSYDLTLPLRRRVFGNDIDGYSWEGNHRYWTILYRQKTGSVLAIQMDTKSWSLNQNSLASSSSKSAKLSLVVPGQNDFDGCRVVRSSPCIKFQE